MTEKRVRSLMVLPRCCACSAIALLCCAIGVLSGCSMRKRPNIPWATAVQVRPVAQAHTLEGNDVLEDPLPELRFELPPFSVRLIFPRRGPPQPPGTTPPPIPTDNQ